MDSIDMSMLSIYHLVSFSNNKPIGASPHRDYELTRMVLGILVGTYSTWFGLVHQKRGGTLRGLRIKRVCRSWYYFNPPQASSLSYFLRYTYLITLRGNSITVPT